MNRDDLLDWLLRGDVAIQYQVQRDLLEREEKPLQERVAREGWGARFLGERNPDGGWGRGFYQPKWTSTHYTLLNLRNLEISEDNPQIRDSLSQIIRDLRSPDGGIFPIGREKVSELCINGMFLNYASYFGMQEEDLKSVVDFLLSEHMEDGGFNCRSNRGGAQHSSMHTTISVLEGISAYAKNGYRHRLEALMDAAGEAREFLLEHRLFRSDCTGEIIDKKWLMLSYPSRWRYDILRTLDYFRLAGAEYDSRMDEAIEVLLKKRRADNRWSLQARHPGATHFEMEKPGGPSRWNTLRALRVLKHFGIDG